ncbi:hypothetical protein H634G_10760 [Metarhizium anisopliae BRIP 53293]|uniref:BHLH domain-containing protein n=1 Tax=Metarhizium anisopliae BRIP 53293 TaxID=1291518 RepID=A0A0D9NJ60_METAN|nr:hypothetical protein H634G_10760 [Metarhizium anisopliae BRIP 53293]KJK90526.1 hypothetical protein H633G_05597 [Metarhizium anisopliae BRIP 53284]
MASDTEMNLQHFSDPRDGFAAISMPTAKPANPPAAAETYEDFSYCQGDLSAGSSLGGHPNLTLSPEPGSNPQELLNFVDAGRTLMEFSTSQNNRTSLGTQESYPFYQDLDTFNMRHETPGFNFPFGGPVPATPSLAVQQRESGNTLMTLEDSDALSCWGSVISCGDGEGEPVSQAAVSSPTTSATALYSSDSSVVANAEGIVQDSSKKNHSMADKRYRLNIKNNFDMLRDSIPSLRMDYISDGDEDARTGSKWRHSVCPLKTLNKVVILQKAIEYIRQLENDNAQLRNVINITAASLETFRNIYNVENP